MKGLLLFLGGTVVGATVAALLTPVKGEELRKIIRNYIAERGLVAVDKLESVVECIAVKIEQEGAE